MGSDYILIEKYPHYQQPVGSVVQHNGQTVFYRNISEKHLFKKGNYKALFIDEAVLQHLLNRQVQAIVYDMAGSGTYSTTPEQYNKARVVKMAGRKQRGLSLERFVKGDSVSIPRPQAEEVIEVN